MVQGLAFLSKKSWHTKNKANQEKVWIAEQKQEQETAKANELAKEIQQEREAEEFNRIAGKKTIKDRGIDWMYQEGTSNELAKEDAEKKAEEFLLGKEYVGEGAIQGDFHDGNKKEGIHSALTKTESIGISRQEPEEESKIPTAKYQVNHASFGPDHNSAQYRNENFTMRVEDPMFFVSQKEREKKDNRDKTTALYHRVVGNGDNEESSNDGSSSSISRKRSKKDRKRRKKKKKKKSSRSRRDYDESESRTHRTQRRHGRHSRSRSRSRSNDRHQKDDNNYARGYDSLSDGSYHSRHERYGDPDRRSYRRNKGGRREYDDNRRFRSNRSSNRMNDHSSSRHKRRQKDVDTATSSPEKTIPPKKQDNRPRKIEGYGLKGASSGSVINRDIGPSKELIRKKKEEQQNLRNRNMQISRSRKKMTDEERVEALQEMQADARKREDRMGQQASYRKHDNEVEMGSSAKRGASFLSEITTRVNGITSDGHSSLSSRVAQNRHTNQRLHDSFL